MESTKPCPMCGAAIDTDAKACPGCGEKFVVTVLVNDIRRFLMVVVGIFFPLSVALLGALKATLPELNTMQWWVVLGCPAVAAGSIVVIFSLIDLVLRRIRGK